MKQVIGSILCLLLVACASPPPVVPETLPSLFKDVTFAPPSERIDVADIFAIDADMREFMEHAVARRIITDGKVMALINSIYSIQNRKFSYDSAQTGNASQVFHQRTGNCLSYTIMTAAFAKQLNLAVQYHSANFDDVWDRNNNIDFKIGHVNLTIGSGALISHDAAMLVDFGAFEDARSENLDDIGENIIVAMYLNNRAAEALAKNNLDDAYWWARTAIEQAPAFVAAYNTLGVIYTRHHDLNAASLVFQRVLAREPDNVLALSNQMQVMTQLGRTAEAQKLNEHLAEIQPNPPYFFFNRGLAFMRSGDYKSARTEFTKEVNRASYNHQFHFWLALADYQLGNFDETRKQLGVAMENSPTAKQHDLYRAKLEKLKSISTQ